MPEKAVHMTGELIGVIDQIVARGHFVNAVGSAVAERVARVVLTGPLRKRLATDWPEHALAYIHLGSASKLVSFTEFGVDECSHIETVPLTESNLGAALEAELREARVWFEASFRGAVTLRPDGRTYARAIGFRLKDEVHQEVRAYLNGMVIVLAPSSGAAINYLDFVKACGDTTRPLIERMRVAFVAGAILIESILAEDEDAASSGEELRPLPMRPERAEALATSAWTQSWANGEYSGLSQFSQAQAATLRRELEIIAMGRYGRKPDVHFGSSDKGIKLPDGPAITSKAAAQVGSNRIFVEPWADPLSINSFIAAVAAAYKGKQANDLIVLACSERERESVKRYAQSWSPLVQVEVVVI